MLGIENGHAQCCPAFSGGKSSRIGAKNRDWAGFFGRNTECLTPNAACPVANAPISLQHTVFVFYFFGDQQQEHGLGVPCVAHFGGKSRVEGLMFAVCGLLIVDA
jgi:hypothetical protein